MDPVMRFSVGILIVIILMAATIILVNIRGPGSRSTPAGYETRRMYFAASVLSGLALIFLQAMAMYYWGGSGADGKGNAVAKDIFDACKTIIPPIVTLVLGFYFSKSDQRPAGTDNAKQGTEAGSG